MRFEGSWNGISPLFISIESKTSLSLFDAFSDSRVDSEKLSDIVLISLLSFKKKDSWRENSFFCEVKRKTFQWIHFHYCQMNRFCPFW